MKDDTPLIVKNEVFDLFESLDNNFDKDLPHIYGPTEDSVFLNNSWDIHELPDLRMFDQDNYGRVDYEEYFQIAVNNGLLRNCTSDEILILAIKGSSLKYVKIAVQLGANVNTDNFHYTSYPYNYSLPLIPIEFACQIGNIDIVKYLYECDADMFLSKAKSSCSVLKIASAYGNLEVVKFLIESGFDVNESENEYESFPIDYAICNNQYEVARYLLEQGANNSQLYNPYLIQNTFDEGWVNLVKLFIEFGANINQQDDYGYSALHLAIIRESFGKIKILVENGADIYLKNKEGETALDIAREENNVEIIRYLAQVDRSIKLKKLMGSIKTRSSSVKHEISSTF